MENNNQHQQLIFERPASTVDIHLEKGYLNIRTKGWTLGIPIMQALDYLDTYNTLPNRGFYEKDGGKGGGIVESVILTHDKAKINFSVQEASQILAMLAMARPLTGRASS